ncbi:MAG: thiamine phosphate synthase [Actinomycetota bacterium]|nr:thiamine phosphate synthase [Actinomycetota bacterium]
MRLPPLLVLTDRSQCDRPLREVVSTAVDAGTRAVVLREKDLSADERAALADELRTVLDPVGGVLVHAGLAGLAGAAGIGAVHLSSKDAFPSPRPWLVGRSCHSADEVSRAVTEACDYVFLSPIFPTASKPGYGPAMGLDRLARLTAGAPPVYALGGVGVDDVGGCLAAGAYGVAVMGPVMRDPRIVAAYLAALGAGPAHRT